MPTLIYCFVFFTGIWPIPDVYTKYQINDYPIFSYDVNRLNNHWTCKLHVYCYVLLQASNGSICQISYVIISIDF